MPPGADSKGTKCRVSPPRGKQGGFHTGSGGFSQDLAQPGVPEAATCSGNVFDASCSGHLGARGAAGDALRTDEGFPGLGASRELP